ncbi:MAG: ParB/RepB/Spo0J family partition protein [Burkholderiaceae bacterium]
MVPIDQLEADPHNPRTEIPQADLDEMTQDIAERGVLQPIVVTPADVPGRYIIRLGSKRWQAARLAGLEAVPVTLATSPIDGYAQVAENLKRHALSPMDLARFIQTRSQAGETNTAIAQLLCIEPTAVTHHLALLSLPEVLDDALNSGRCTSPRTLYELSKLHDEHPERVTRLIDSDAALTRAAVATMRDTDEPVAVARDALAAVTMEGAGVAEPSGANPLPPRHSPRPTSCSIDLIQPSPAC